MRLIGTIVTGILGVAVVAQGAYIVHTRRQVASMADRLETLSDDYARDVIDAPVTRSWGAPPAPDDFDEAPAFNRGRSVPRLTVAPPSPGAPDPNPSQGSLDPLPLPAGFDSPEAREQLRQFVVAQMEREREEARVRQQERREERERERRQQMAKELGLSPAEAERFEKVHADAALARDKLRERLQSGEIEGPAIRDEMMALRNETERQMRTLLGDDRLNKLEQMQGGPGRRGGGRLGFRGGPGGGDGPGFGGPGGPRGP